MNATLPDPDTFYQAWTRRLMNDKTDTLDAIAREILRTIDQHIFGSNGEVDSYLRGIVHQLTALSNQGEGAEADRRDAERLDWLDAHYESYGFEDQHEGNRWLLEGPYMTARDALDAAIAATQEQT